MGDDQSGNGLTFDTGFAADFWLGVTGGNDPYEFYANFAELYVDEQNPGVAYELGLGRAADETHGGLLFGDNPDVILATIDNSNTSGVAAGLNTIGPNENPSDVTTGVEISIPLSALDSPQAPFRVCVFINGIGHDWVSNQVLGGIGGGGNPGEPRDVSFAAIPGDQFFEVPLDSYSDL